MTYTVLMSVYAEDSPEFLAEALKSIYEDQTRKPDQVVVVFDGPLWKAQTDVLNAFRDGKEDIVTFVELKRGMGLGDSLRVGTDYCTGDYIFRMDSDDISHPERFRIQAEYVEAHPDVDVLGTDIAEFRESIDEDMRVRACPKDHDDIVSMSRSRNPMNHVSVCIKRSALRKCGGYVRLLLLEDYYLWLRMIVGGAKLANLNQPLVYVRVGNGFEKKRGSRLRIEGWDYLQQYMVHNGLVSRFRALRNRAYIRGFVWTPTFVKKALYSTILRKKHA